MGFAQNIARKVESIYLTGPTLGERVDKAAVTLPAGAGTVEDNLFTVSGGRIMLRSLIGQVTTLVGVVTSMTVKLTHTPTTGAAVATDMCTGLDTNADDVDTMYTIPGGVGAPMVDDARAGVAVPSFDTTNKQILQPGTIKMNTVNVGGTGSGAIKWTLHYIPIDAGVAVVAA